MNFILATITEEKKIMCTTTPERINQIAFQLIQNNKELKFASKKPVSEKVIRENGMLVFGTIGVISEKESLDFANAIFKRLKKK